MIEKKSIDELLERIDIVELISNYIELRRQGSSYVGVCPFHDDHSPSLSVSANKGFYHCFACKAGGNGYTFVMEYEHINFPEAVEKVASMFDYELKYSDDKGYNQGSSKHILAKLNAYYKQQLFLDKNKTALSYLYSRGLNKEDILRFELGYAPSSNESLNLLKNEKISFQDAISVGALKNSGQKTIASFINRISFPIFDHKDSIIGFGGRSLNPKIPAKYLNSPNSKCFNKSRVLYAINLAIKPAMKAGELIICEGYMDAIAFYKMGYENTVAVLGTALTSSHLPLLKRLGVKIILCFDSDKAGLDAAFKSAKLLSTEQIDGKVAFLKGGKDAAELMQEGKQAEVQKAFAKANSLIEFYVKELVRRANISSMMDKQKCLQSIQLYCKSLPLIVAKSLEDLVSKLLGISKDDFSLDGKVTNIYIKKSKNTNNKEISQLDFLRFIYERKDLRYFDFLINSKALVNQDILRAVYSQKGVEDENIRVLLSKDLGDIKDDLEFARLAIKINLSYFSEQKNPDIIRGYIFRILDLLENRFGLFCSLFADKSHCFEAVRSILLDLRVFRSEDEAEDYNIKMEKFLNKGER